MKITGLPKISLNEWYAGKHWTQRKKVKDVYSKILNQFDEYKDGPYFVEYVFEFSKKPLDCSNCVAMLKMIEDCLFPNDSYKIVQKISIESRKGKDDCVFVEINKLK